MKIFIKNFLLIFLFMQSLGITETIETKLQKSIRKSAIKESVELKNMVNRMVIEPRTYVQKLTEREKSLMRHYAKKERAASWLIFGVNLLLVALFSWLAVIVNRKKSNNSFESDPASGSA